MATDDDGTKPGLPSGLLTFVFTDIEASTRLYKVLGDHIAGDVFDLHNIHLRAAWDAFGGYEVHTEGDSFFVVFEDPNDAIAACIDVQHRLAATDWPGGAEVRVRIGIHCGLAAPRNDDYMALAVHQAARVMSAANGNQVLVTDAILQRLDPLEGATVSRAGRYRLRDFDEAPTLYRVDSTTLAPNEHPPRATPANHHNLVPRLTSFVGRDSDVVAVSDLLAPATALMVAGLGGMGKTRLAIEVGLQVAPTWESGVWMVELAEVVDPELIAEEVASSIGVDATGVGDRWDDVIDFIGDKGMLLILDNVEHLIEDIAQMVPRLVRSCPNSAVLSTSREPLNCQGEVVYRLNPLDVTPETEDSCLIPSVELFLDRARAVRPDFDGESEQFDEVLEICRDLDGLPLAIEIAAAQVGVLQLSEIRSGLNNRFRLLRSRDRALPERQRTMEGLLGWSYQLLTESEQRAFRRLAVFGGSFSKEAAEAALAGEGIDADDVPELIWALVDKSLIAADLSDSATRYRLLESVQQYAMRLLIDNDDPVRVAAQLSDWLLSSVAPWLPNDRVWLGNVAIELPNIRSVVDLIADARTETAQQLVCSVGRYHDALQLYRSGVESLSKWNPVLATPTASRLSLLATQADLQLKLGDVTAGTETLAHAREIEREIGAPDWEDVALDRIQGEIAMREGDFASASSIALASLDGEPSPHGAARMWSMLGIAQCASGDLAPGQRALEEALALYLELDQTAQVGVAHSNIAEAAWRRGIISTAAAHQNACLDIALAIGQRVVVGYSLVMAAHIAGRTEQWATATRLAGAGSAFIAEASHQLYEDDKEALDVMLREASRALGAAEMQTQLEVGNRTDIVTAADLARGVFDRCDDVAAPSLPDPST